MVPPYGPISIRNLEETSSKPGLSNKRLDCVSLRSHNLNLLVRLLAFDLALAFALSWVNKRRIVACALNPPYGLRVHHPDQYGLRLLRLYRVFKTNV